MPQHYTYMLHIYRSRTVSGWQWAARLEQLPGRTSRRFTDQEALLAHLRTVVHEGDQADLSSGGMPGTARLATTGADGEEQDAI